VDKRAVQANKRVLRAMGKRRKKSSQRGRRAFTHLIYGVVKYFELQGHDLP